MKNGVSPAAAAGIVVVLLIVVGAITYFRMQPGRGSTAAPASLTTAGSYQMHMPPGAKLPPQAVRALQRH